MTHEASKQRRSPRHAALLLLLALATLGVVLPLVLRDGSVAASPLVHTFTAGDTGPVAFHGALDRTAVLLGSDGTVKMELVLRAAPEAASPVRTPTDFVVILDRSGSMAGTKIEQARAAVHELLDRLQPGDRLAVVLYSDAAEVLIPLTPVSLEVLPRWRSLVARVEADGWTAMSDGLDLAAGVLARQRQAGRACRLLLVSDGLANMGDSSWSGLTGRAAAAARQEQVLSAIGVGLDFDENLMSAMADAGTGNFYYLEDTRQLADVFAGELAATQTTVASSVRVTIEPAAGVTVVDAAGYPLEQTGSQVSFRPGTLFAGQERRIWITLRVLGEAVGTRPLGSFQAHYAGSRGEASTLVFAAVPAIALVGDSAAALAAVDRDIWARSVVEAKDGQLRKQVATYVREGQRAAALAEIARYRAENSALNQDLQSAEVDANLSAVDELEAQVEEAFTGAGQATKQNVLSKAQVSKSWDGLRRGSKKVGDGKKH